MSLPQTGSRNRNRKCLEPGLFLRVRQALAPLRRLRVAANYFFHSSFNPLRNSTKSRNSRLLSLPTRSSGIADLVAGHVELAFLSIQPLIPQVKAGKLRALAITSGTRSPAIPELPTIAESGLPGYDIGTWWGLLAPAKTALPIVDRLAAAMRKATAVPSVRERFAAGGIAAQSNTPKDFAAMIKSEVGRYRELASAAGVKPE